MAPIVVFSYSHRDEDLRDQVETQLAMLKRQGIIHAWHDRRINAGQDFAAEISRHIEDAGIILLLVSADYLASDYCYEKEMARALERHASGEAVVIPVILRACDWLSAPFGHLLATPRDGKPVTQFADRDQALLEVAKAVRAAAERMAGRSARPPAVAPTVPPPSTSARIAALGPRSSSLALAKSFSDRDKDRFGDETFEYMARFFENSLEELGKRNKGVEGIYRRIDANAFTSSIYRDGKAVGSCTVYRGASAFAEGIAYSGSERRDGFNEMLTVHADDESLFLKSMGMASFGRNAESKLTQEGAAELYWSILIEPLQSRSRR